MKTQISRNSHRPGARYSGVYQQQGRMITDADWNELVDVGKDRLEGSLRDAVASGVPREGGVAIRQPAPGQPLAVTPGRLYADGVPARVAPAADLDPPPPALSLAQQEDFPLPPGTDLPTQGYVVYADVWERAVSALEDPDPLRDPGLHGADTCTRTRTMAQLKWCPAAVNPEDEGENPHRGDSRLTLELRAPSEEADPCDPCADVVGLDARTGNHLFRLEVHDVEGPPEAPTRLILKWSSENGAEEYEVDPLPPPEFREEGRIFEFFSDRSEKHLGVQLAPGLSPDRGRFEPSYPAAPPAGLERVRRWDGFCVLRREGLGWALQQGRDRGAPLTIDGNADAQGHVTLGSAFEVKLKGLGLRLSLEGRSFVAGDFWLATIREAIAEVGDTLLDEALPEGVLHSYLRLAEVDGAGTLVEATGAERRRLVFPPLTDLRAGDVGYEADADCALLQNADTVKEALDELCRRPAGGGGCEVTVGKGGEFVDLPTAVEKLIARGDRDLNLCLLPGDHGLERPLAVENDEKPLHVAISGSGAGTRLRLADNASMVFLGVTSVSLRGFEVRVPEDSEVVFKGCSEVEIAGCSIAGFQGDRILVTIAGAHKIRVVDSDLEVVELERFQRIAGILRHSPLVRDLFSEPLERGEFNLRLPEVARSLASMNLNARRNFVRRVNSDQNVAEMRKMTFAEAMGLADLNLVLSLEATRRDAVAAALDRLRTAATEGSTGLGLVIDAPRADVSLRDNRFAGSVSFYGVPGGNDLNRDEQKSLRELLSNNPRIFSRGAGRLVLSRNRFCRLLIGGDIVTELRRVLTNDINPFVEGLYRSAFLSDNVFLRGLNWVVAKDLKVTSNAFERDVNDIGVMIAAISLFLGNHNEEPDFVMRNVAGRTAIDNLNIMTIAAP